MNINQSQTNELPDLSRLTIPQELESEEKAALPAVPKAEKEEIDWRPKKEMQASTVVESKKPVLEQEKAETSNNRSGKFDVSAALYSVSSGLWLTLGIMNVASHHPGLAALNFVCAALMGFCAYSRTQQ